MTLQELKAKDSAFIIDPTFLEEFGSWEIMFAIHRDSEYIHQSNLNVITDRLQKHKDDFTEMEVNCWAYGWRRYLLVKPKTEASEIVLKLLAEIQLYPILDEDSVSFCDRCSTSYNPYESEWTPYCCIDCYEDDR